MIILQMFILSDSEKRLILTSNNPTWVGMSFNKPN